MDTPDIHFLAELEDLLNQVLGHPKGTLALKALCERHAGAEIYIPTATERFICWRNEQIRNEFRGDYRGLEIKWRLSESQLRRIISGE